VTVAPEVDTNDTRDADHAHVVGVPCRAEGVTLLGELEGSGFKETPYLARRGDGQTIQLTELLYHVLEEIDGTRDFEAVADEVSDRIGKRAAADDIAFLVEEKLRPLGHLCADDGYQPKVEKPNPLLALRARFVISNDRVTRRITAPFATLFWPPIVVAVTAGFFAATGWLLFGHGLAGGTRQVMYQPSLIVLLFVLTALSAGFHEFGHAAACRYGGATPGAMGAGIYLVWPAFYTDVTDSYRLSKGGRLRTDLGGLYFNMLFGIGMFGLWAITGWDSLLLMIPLQLLQMVHQLLPFVRLDGYLILADVTGVPDLFSRIKPTLLSLVPWRESDSRVVALKRWVRVVVTIWVLAVIPVLLFGMTMMAMTLPRLAATAWDSAGRQLDVLGAAGADLWTRAAAVISLFALVLPILSSVYMLGRILLRTAKNRYGRFLVLPALATLAWLWWPNGEYQPIQRGERGTVQDSVRAVAALPTGRPGLTVDREAELEEDTPASTTTTTSTTVPGESSTTTVVDAEPSTATTAGSRATTTTTEAPATTTTAAPTTTTTAAPTTTETSTP
jgi:putative peptide zinc metalloprotease protein